MRDEKEIRGELDDLFKYLLSDNIECWEKPLVRARINALRWVLYEL